MTILMVSAFAIWFFGLGVFVGRKFFSNDGLVLIDDSNPEKTYWTLDIHCDPRDILKKRELRLKVKRWDGIPYDSHENHSF